MMRLWRMRESRPVERRRPTNIRLSELETAKEVLEEVFHARPSNVEEMIKRGLRRGAGLEKKSNGLKNYV